jgi:hypothetical protein
MHWPLGARISTLEKVRVAVVSRWWALAAAEGLRVPPARETGTGVVGLVVGMPALAAGVVAGEEAAAAALDAGALEGTATEAGSLDAGAGALEAATLDAGALLSTPDSVLAAGAVLVGWAAPAVLVALVVFGRKRLADRVRRPDLVVFAAGAPGAAVVAAGASVAATDSTSSGLTATSVGSAASELTTASLGSAGSGALLGAAAPRLFPGAARVAAAEVFVFLVFLPFALTPNAAGSVVPADGAALAVTVRMR